MPYKTFYNWCFDGNIKNQIPQGEGIPDILKYNSPIHADFLMKSFVTNGKLNHYLNKYLNNIGVRYINKKDLFYFFKQCVIDYKIKRKDIHYVGWAKNNILFNKLSKKRPLLKKDEIQIICELIDKSDDKESIYRSFGIDKKEFKKKKMKKKQTKISTKNFIAQNFGIM